MTKKVSAPGLIVLLSAVCLTSIASAQTSWSRTYGGTGDDEGHSVQQTTDGGYIIAGSTSSFGAGGYDVYLIKTNAQGDTIWTRTYGGANDDAGNSVQQTTDGGYIIAGSSESFGAGGSDVYLVKTDAQGDTLWTRTYRRTDWDYGYSVQQTTDGGYIIAGQPYLVKTNASGDTLWTRSYGSRCVQQTTDGGYIIAGICGFGAGYDDVYLVKANASGDTLWTRIYGGPLPDGANSVQQTTDGGYIIAGYTWSFGADSHVYVIKTDASGDSTWTRSYDGWYTEYGYSVQQTTDGGYIIAGYDYPSGASWPDVCLIKTDAAGGTLWARTYGGTNDDEGWSVQQTSDGGYIIAGTTYSFGPGAPDSCNVYLIKTDSLGNVGVEERPAGRPAGPTQLLVQPNPFTSVARVPGHETEFFALSDVTGRQVAICKGDRIGAGLRPGVYFLSPVGPKTGKAVTTTVIKAAF